VMLYEIQASLRETDQQERTGRLTQREPGTPPPALSKEEKKRNRPSTL
jgi:hypothetical protein